MKTKTTRGSKSAPSAVAAIAVMSMADVAALSATDAAAAFKGRSDIRQAAFVEQGKLVLHLDSMKLKAGQSVYGLLTAQGVPEGSVNNARLCADVLKAVVIPGHLPETRFDSIVTFRIVRQSRRLLNGKAAIKLEPAALAAILSDGNQAQIGSELDCLAEHGQTIAEREAALKAEEKQAAALATATAAAEKLKAKEDAKAAKEAAKEAAKAPAATTTEPPVETPAPETDSTPPVETPAETPAPEVEPATTPPVETDPESPEETAAPIVVDERKPAPALTVVESVPTVEAVIEEVTTAAAKAFQFNDPAEMEKIALILEQAAADLRACIPAVEKVA